MRVGGGISGGSGGVDAVRSKGNIASTGLPGKGVNADTNDVLSVSSAAQLVSGAHEKINEMPNVRTSGIEAVQNQLNSGNYRPDTSAVVDSLLREHILRSS
ncbi:MAG: flagellar biosynthesis anti-sigma factor FlgM [Holophagaceae bacterium]|nr:flagellar biosynthesis anti-sigma factor FlgM [Holophagaceae bacterium]